jgi:NAD-dependent deacetylase
MDTPADLVRRLRESQACAALTGAGISQESGLRTFRDAQSGLWAQYRPEDLASPEAFRRDPKTVWDWYAWRRQAVAGARPNAGHLAIAAMSRLFPVFTLITQNVDGLHLMAGSPEVVELHGNIRRVRCADCGSIAPSWEEVTGEVPRCAICGGLLRPDVVWFGEPLPRERLEAALAAARACDLFFSIGTSGIVQPAASLAYAARNRGAVLVEVNAEPTPLTPKVDFALRGKAGEILPALVEAAWGSPISTRLAGEVEAGP